MKGKSPVILLRLILLPAVLALVISCTERKVISLKSLLTEMTDRSSLTMYPDPFYTLKQFSSYDRRSEYPDSAGWFANADYTQFTGVDSSKGRKEYILFDAMGPGAIVRWWMTFAGEGSADGTIRVYIDGGEIPVIEDNVVKVLSGHLLAGEPLSTSVSPLTEPGMRGHNLYLPIPYSTSCLITYECEAIRITPSSRKPSIYYNICYRTYEEGTSVVSFSADELEKAQTLIGEVNSILTDHPGQFLKHYSLISKTEPGDSSVLEINGRNSALSQITLQLASDDYPQALRSTVLEISFDDHRTVWVPSGEFFGTGYDTTTSSTWFSSVDERKMESFWLMPYRKKCRIVLINYGKYPAELKVTAETVKYKWRANSMYFGSSWHEYHNIRTAGSDATGGSGKHRDINFIDIYGKGVYAGDAITVFNTEEAWFGEGDEKIFVDGEIFPSSIGTGTEDYYGYAWCRPEPFSHPFIAQPSGAGNFFPGMTINMRYRSLDAIPFTGSISSNIELWHWVPATINYALTTYWYAFPGYESNIAPQPMSVKNPVARIRADIISQ